MSADELRKAAETLRERASAAQDVSGGWFRAEFLAHIATMHPGVGLALADWLDQEALAVTTSTGETEDHLIIPEALEVARLINGGAP